MLLYVEQQGDGLSLVMRGENTPVTTGRRAFIDHLFEAVFCTVGSTGGAVYINSIKDLEEHSWNLNSSFESPSYFRLKPTLNLHHEVGSSGLDWEIYDLRSFFADVAEVPRLPDDWQLDSA